MVRSSRRCDSGRSVPKKNGPVHRSAQRSRSFCSARNNAALARKNASQLPLYGVPFAVKDNIDVLGLPTTAACPAFAYSPAFDATSVANLRVVAPSSPTGGSTGLNACAGIGFTVLHNDRAGAAYLPGGAYTVSSRTMDCGTASADFTSFLAGAGKAIPGWNTTSPAAGRATFTQRNSGLSFSVAKNR